MEGVERVEQLDDRHLHRVFGGSRHERAPRSRSRSSTSASSGARSTARATSAR